MAMLWAVALVAIFLLPFFPSEVLRREAFCLYIILLLSALCVGASRKVFLKNNSILLPLSAWLLVIIFTSLFSNLPPVALNEALYFLVYAALFMVIAGLDSKMKEQIALVLIGACFFVSLRAILQHSLYFDKVIPYIISHKRPLTTGEFLFILDAVSRRRALSTFTNPNLFASYLVMIETLTLGFAYNALKKRQMRIFFILSIVLIVNLYGLWVARSLACFASLIFGGSLFFVLLYFKDGRKVNRFSYLLVFSTLSVFILFVILFIRRFIYDNGPDNISVSLKGRLEFFRTAVSIIREKPLSFAGLGNFGYLYQIRNPLAGIRTTMAHNILLQLWIETGIYGLAAFIWFLTMLIYNSIKGMLKVGGEGSPILRISALCAACAFLFHNMAGFSFFVPQTAMIWWLLCALVL